MNPSIDGPASPLFTPLGVRADATLVSLNDVPMSQTMRDRLRFAPSGDCVGFGIPFHAEAIPVRDQAVNLSWEPITAPWLVFQHTTDVIWLPRRADGAFEAPPGPALLRDHAADYVVRYANGLEERAPILRQHHIGMCARGWGQHCFEAVSHRKPHPHRTLTEQPRPGVGWGGSQTRASIPDLGPWTNWIWAWQNPHPDVPVIGVRIEPRPVHPFAGGTEVPRDTAVLVLFGVTAGRCRSLPTRWETRRKALLSLPNGEAFDPNLSPEGLSAHVKIDLGQVISVLPHTVYPNASWADTYNNKAPEVRTDKLLVEYAAHPEAQFHFGDGAVLPVSAISEGDAERIVAIAPSSQRVRITVTDKATGKLVPAKLHIHGAAGEYLPPVDRARIPNIHWYEDWSVDFISLQDHNCTYISGDTWVDLPLGPVYVEISKGFEIAPIRKVARVSRSTREIGFTVDRVLPWRDKGWVTADTHVHFLSPTSAHLEGAAEGVNVVNLLASQWGELMTNVGDFDGRNTYGSRECGGDGEYLVRVGTENRQHVLGHISLLGYNGPIIAPMTVGGPDESALGDSVDVLLTEWAQQCRKQGGIVVVPHFPFPRAENAAAIIRGEVDGIEMTAWSNLYGGIDPYSLADWYRYLNNGYFVAAVGGTDKMAATTAVGCVRTYAKLPMGRSFTYDAWKEAIRSGNTFATYGPLMEFSVEGKPPGTRVKLPRSGGTLDVEFELASVTTPMTHVDLIVNGEVRQSRQIKPRQDKGHWSIKVDRSSWIALLVRGKYPDRNEMIAAHSSPVVFEVEGKPFFAAADALTILHQIEGAMAYLDTIGTRAEDAAYKRMRLVLTGAFRELHNKMHRQGAMHDHTPATDHAEHRGKKE